jgi:hypothetical protein
LGIGLTDQRLTRAGAISNQQRDATRRAIRGGSAAGPSNGARSGAAAELARVDDVRAMLASLTPWACAASSRVSDRAVHDDRTTTCDVESADGSCSSISLVCCSRFKDAVACGRAAVNRDSCERTNLPPQQCDRRANRPATHPTGRHHEPVARRNASRRTSASAPAQATAPGRVQRQSCTAPRRFF